MKKKEENRGGKPGAIGVDVGGTKINAGLIDEAGEVLHQVSLPTMAGHSDTGEQVIKAIALLLAEIEVSCQHSTIKGIGIGSAGQIDWRRGSVRHASELIPAYTGTPLQSIVQERFGLPVYVDNDVNVLALTEMRFGAAREAREFVCLTLGTGVGGAIVSDGKLLHGTWGGAGEIGHMSIDWKGPACVCGGRGCLEHYASGTSIGRRMRERLAAAGKPVDEMDARAVIARWHQGDVEASAVMQEAIHAIGAVIASILHLLNPHLIVLGGGVADAGERFFAEIRLAVQERAMPSLLEDVRIVPAWQGNWSGMIGAAMQVYENSQPS